MSKPFLFRRQVFVLYSKIGLSGIKLRNVQWKSVLWLTWGVWATIISSEAIRLTAFLVTPRSQSLFWDLTLHFYITTKAQVKLFTEEEAWFLIAGGCHHCISSSAFSFVLSSIPQYVPYRIRASYIWIHYIIKSVRMRCLIPSPYVLMYCIFLLYTTFWHLSRLTHC